jgi:autotransporter family porin
MSKIIYVNDENTKGPWLGHSWKNAYNKLQDALAVAQRGSQIWVAKGTYKPTEGDDRYASFFMKEDVELYGGFDGTEKELSQRDWKKNETILSGNIGDPNNSKVNSFHIVVGVDNAAIDGFTITEGNALDDVPGAPWSQAGPPPGPPQGGPPQGPPPGDDEDGPHIHLTPDMVVGNIPAATGAGMVIHQCAPEVRNCVFKDNVAGKGGGLYVMVATHDENGDIIEDNEAPLIINCDFINNFALKRGGGVSNDMMTHPTYVNCKFIRNRCAEKGGGMYNDFECSPTLISCLFAENSAVMAAGNGNDGNSNPLFVNCTVTRNEAEEVGAGIYQGTGPSNNPVIINSIVWGNICDNDEANIANWHQCGPEVSFSCIEGGYAGLGNIDQDPRFVDPENLDFRLDSMSPCIDAGDGEVAPETDIEGNPRYKDKKVPTGLMAQKVITGQFGKGEPVIIPPADMGAYERQEDSVVEPMDVIYVRSDVASNGEGSSWDSTYKNLQQAMDHAFSAGADVWVKSGTYKPTETLNRETSFILREGVKVYGGFKGDETSLDRRDYKNNETILTGDLGGSNSYHVLIGANDAVLDGFTITGGCADGPLYNKKGGGMINYAPGKDTDPFQPPIGYSPKVTNCIFKDNFAMDGAAVYSFDRGKAEFTNCIFENNKAGSSGGAVMDNVGAFSTFDTCTFKGNTCQFKGGAIFLDYGSRATIKTCKFEDNKAGVNGGAIYTISRASQLENTRVTFDDCEFSRNTTGKRGGAVYNFDASFITFTKCAFTENKAGLGGGAIATDFDAVSTIKDCSFNANSSEQGENDIDKDDRGIVKQ